MTVWRPTGVVAFGTRHGKLPLVAPALVPLGLDVQLTALDTDSFGTFDLAVPRPGSQRETAMLKAQASAEQAGVRYGLSSEGAFSSHPLMPLLGRNLELVCLWDTDRDVAVFGRAHDDAPTHAAVTLDAVDHLDSFLAGIGFGEQAVTVRAIGVPVVKLEPLTERSAVVAAVTTALAESPEARAEVVTDLRAHVNPRRRETIRRAAEDLADRLSTACPACQSHGFGREQARDGLPCRDCGGRTSRTLGWEWECPHCGHMHLERSPDESAAAESCFACNP